MAVTPVKGLKSRFPLQQAAIYLCIHDNHVQTKRFQYNCLVPRALSLTI